MLWRDPTFPWNVGRESCLGQSKCLAHSHGTDASLPENVTGDWNIAKHCQGKFAGWTSTSAVKVKVLPPATTASDADVSIVGTRTREERDAEGRKRAIDLESESERKRAKTALETRVAKARSLCDTTIDERAGDLAHSAFKEYMANKIDEAELKRRKQAAREQASKEHEALAQLDKAFGAYTAATAARVAAEQALASAIKAEDDAADKVDEALRAIEESAENGGGAGPSGVVKSE